jgi:uncharacterized protein YacL
MDLLIFCVFLFVLGAIGVVLLKVAKNVAYVLFVIVIGAVIWNYFGKPFAGSSPTQMIMELNDSFAKKAMNNIEEGNKNTTNKITDSVVSDVDESIENALNGEGIEAWEIEKDSKGYFRTVFQRLINKITSVFQ